MHIQVNSDSSVAVDAALSAFVESNLRSGLARLAGQISRVEVHLSDVNGERSGSRDKRCLMEARPAGRDPVVVTEQAATVETAVRGAIQKVDRLLGSDFGRLEARR